MTMTKEEKTTLNAVKEYIENAKKIIENNSTDFVLYWLENAKSEIELFEKMEELKK